MMFKIPFFLTDFCPKEVRKKERKRERKERRKGRKGRKEVSSHSPDEGESDAADPGAGARLVVDVGDDLMGTVGALTGEGVRGMDHLDRPRPGSQHHGRWLVYYYRRRLLRVPHCQAKNHTKHQGWTIGRHIAISHLVQV